MTKYIDLWIPASSFSDDDIMSMLTDRLWTDDDIESMTEMLVTKCIDGSTKTTSKNLQKLS